MLQGILIVTGIFIQFGSILLFFHGYFRRKFKSFVRFKLLVATSFLVAFLLQTGAIVYAACYSQDVNVRPCIPGATMCIPSE